MWLIRLPVFQQRYFCASFYPMWLIWFPAFQQRYFCASFYPMWLDLQGGNLPAPGETSEAQACGGGDVSNCCSNPRPVTVRNCDTFFIYYLQATEDQNYNYCTQNVWTAFVIALLRRQIQTQKIFLFLIDAASEYLPFWTLEFHNRKNNQTTQHNKCENIQTKRSKTNYTSLSCGVYIVMLLLFLFTLNTSLSCVFYSCFYLH